MVDTYSNTQPDALQEAATSSDLFDHTSRLPVEILDQVFLWTHALYVTDNGATVMPNCAYLSHVCRRWREVALRCQTLWSDVVRPTYEATQFCLARCPTHPLNLFIGSRYTQVDDDSETYREAVDLAFTVVQRADAIRVRLDVTRGPPLDLAGALTFWNHIFGLKALLSRIDPFPARELEIEYGSETGDTFNIDGLLQHSPRRLAVAHLSGCTTTMPREFSSTHLRELRLHNSVLWHDVDELVAFLQAVPLLETLEYSYDQNRHTDMVYSPPSDSLPEVTLKYLRHVNLRSFWREDVMIYTVLRHSPRMNASIAPRASHERAIDTTHLGLLEHAGDSLIMLMYAFRERYYETPLSCMTVGLDISFHADGRGVNVRYLYVTRAPELGKLQYLQQRVQGRLKSGPPLSLDVCLPQDMKLMDNAADRFSMLVRGVTSADCRPHILRFDGNLATFDIALLSVITRATISLVLSQLSDMRALIAILPDLPLARAFRHLVSIEITIDDLPEHPAVLHELSKALQDADASLSKRARLFWHPRAREVLHPPSCGHATGFYTSASRWHGELGSTVNASDGLANTGAELPPIPDYVRLLPPQTDDTVVHGPPLEGPKVTTSLRPVTNPEVRAKPGKRPKWKPAGGAHRGRGRTQWTKKSKLAALISSRVSPKRFWSTYKRLLDPRRRAPKVSITGLLATFKKRMNKPSVPHPTFNRFAQVAAHAEAQNLAAVTPLIAPDDTFTRPFTAEDIASVKADIKDGANSGAPGFDGVRKSLFMDMDNEALAALLNECVARQDAPSVWLKTVIVGIMKKGLPEHDPNSYRTIGLECVVLKVMTLLIHKRLYAWAEANNILPPAQNGFRHGFRTNNNVFIMRTILEKYRPSKQPVYVAFIDISNAFPSTDRDILFVKLQRMGCVGPVVDWLRRLYKDMAYVVQLEGAYSEEFSSDIGVLIGDPSSPTLWNLFLSDFCPPEDEQDPIIAGVRMPILTHADDMVGMKLGDRGMQALLSYVGRYSSRSQVVTNAIKTKMLCVGPIPKHPTTFHLQGIPIQYVTEADYIGIPCCTTVKDFFDLVYERAAARANWAALAITGARSVVGRLRPVDAKTLYDARVDCYQILAADVVPDIGSKIDALEKIQQAFARRVLGLRKRSLIIPLYTELGMVPIRYRRLKLALRFLRYVVTQPAGRYVRLAMQEAIQMFDAGIPGWLGDLRHALLRLPHPVELPKNTRTLWNPATADDLIRSVDASLHAELQDAIMTYPRLYLLRDRTEPQKRGRPTKPVLQLRHYLISITDDDERIALTKLLVSDHPFALEQFRWSSTRNGIERLKVAREDRLCRLCGLAVESPEHALLVCEGVQELIDARKAFAEQVRVACPDFVNSLPSLDAETVLVALISTAEVAVLLGAFTKTVFNIYDSYALEWPTLYTRRVNRGSEVVEE
ncbi:unnamed protein product [Peniophora sp. CBMAI 1063]|nr:unnamed protein product [Peniophora sp. CBMAI 1063]